MIPTLFQGATYVACSVSAAPLRRDASHRAEQTSQLLFGERAELLELSEETGWARIRTEWDNYEGWCKWGQLGIITAAEFAAHRRILTTTHDGMLRGEHGAIQLPMGAELSGLRKGAISFLPDTSWKFKGEKADARKLHFSVDAVLAVCKSMLHAPYLWGGRNLAGIDCSGLVQVAFKACGIRVLRDASQQATMGEEVHFLQEAAPGDLAFFDNAEGRIVHVGILIDRQTIIHATDTAGRVTIDSIDNGGIISRALRRRTHQLRTLRKIGPELTGG